MIIEVMGVVSYVIGLVVECSICTTVNVKFHDGGFLGAGYSTHDNRSLEPKDIWWAVIWPLRLTLYFLAGCLGMVHILLAYTLLLFYIKYKDTVMYDKIDRILFY